MSLITPIPNGPFYSDPGNYVNSPQGYLVVGTGLSVTADGTLLAASAAGGTVTAVTAGLGLNGGTITTTGVISLKAASATQLGGIKVGANLTVAADGTLSAPSPGVGTISGVTAGNGLQGGGITGTVGLSVLPAAKGVFGGVSIGAGIDVSSGTISLAAATEADAGGLALASSAEVIAGSVANKAITPATLQTKVASTTVRGLVQLSDSVLTNDSSKAATQTAAKTAFDAAVTAQGTANAALPKAGGTMTGVITFAAGQTFPGVAFPVATVSTPGVVQIGAGLNIDGAGLLTNAFAGTVTTITAGEGLGAPATGNVINTSGTLKLLPPTGTSLGGVKAGNNISIGVDGTISVPADALIATNNPFAFNGYIWPTANGAPALPCPGTTGQILTISDNVTGQLAWTDPATEVVLAGTGIAVSTVGTTATVSLATVSSVVAGSYGATGLIPTLSVNEYGQITSAGLANPYSPYQTATVTAPPILDLDFADNNLNWEWTLQDNTTIPDPLNAESGQSGYLLITQNPITPYVITWGSAWKFENSNPYPGNPAAGTVDLVAFTVVSPNYIVVTSVVTNLG
jgi:hypothetical protein